MNVSIASICLSAAFFAMTSIASANCVSREPLMVTEVPVTVEITRPLVRDTVARVAPSAIPGPSTAPKPTPSLSSTPMLANTSTPVPPAFVVNDGPILPQSRPCPDTTSATLPTAMPQPKATAEREPPPRFWVLAAPEGLAEITASIKIAILDIVVSPCHITVVYSVGLPDWEPVGTDAKIGEASVIIGSNGSVHNAVRVQSLANAGRVTLGAATFEPYKPDGAEMRLQIPDLLITDSSSSDVRRTGERIDLHLLTRLRPHDHSRATTRFRGLGISPDGAIVAGLPGSSVGGGKATVGYIVDGAEKWFRVGVDGRVEPLN